MSTDRHWSLTLNSDVLRSMIANAWAEIPDDMTGDYEILASAVSALVEQRDEARAERDRPGVDDRNAKAIASIATREGYAAALDDVIKLTNDMWDSAHQATLAYLRGWAQGRLDGAK